MDEQKIQELLMKLVDGKASATETEAFEKLAAADQQLKDEYIAMRRIKEVTDSMKFKELPDQFWGGYWGQVYNKLERGIGWILFSAGVLIVALFGLYNTFSDFFLNGEISLILRAGVFVGGVGAVVLLWSILREVLFARRHERYKEVER